MPRGQYLKHMIDLASKYVGAGRSCSAPAQSNNWRTIDQVHPRIEAHVDLSLGIGRLGLADVSKHAGTAECHRTETERRHLEAAASR